MSVRGVFVHLRLSVPPPLLCDHLGLTVNLPTSADTQARPSLAIVFLQYFLNISYSERLTFDTVLL